jgi:hypothetical protein
MTRRWAFWVAALTLTVLLVIASLIVLIVLSELSHSA